MPEDPQGIIVEITERYDHLSKASHYELLGVTPEASEEEIRSKFRELAKRYHSDRYAGVDLPEDVAQKMTRLLSMVSRAHSVLTNPAKRKDYDATLAMKEAGLPTDLGTIVEAESLFRSGRTLLEKGKYAAALEKFEKAHQLNPAESEFLEYATYTKYWTLPQTSEGKPADRRAVKLVMEHLRTFKRDHPNHDNVCVHLGILTKLEESPERALVFFREALAINPKNLDANREVRLHEMRKDKTHTSFFKRLFKKSK